MREIIVDSFAGGGGASTGIELALGVSPDIAINHDAMALAMHRINHPKTLHLPHNIWKVDPTAVCKGRPVGLLWASPDCKHFSKAKGGKPVEKSIRDLAWVIVRWAKQVAPRVIIMENVEEFKTWGPLGPDNRPCKERKGQDFDRFIRELKRHGYKVEWRELRACDYGAPTIRRRLFMIARRDGLPIIWPKPSHAPAEVSRDGIVKRWAKGHGLTLADIQQLSPWRMAAEIIDWSLPIPSIFDTAEEIRAKHGLRAIRPLKGPTLKRLAIGVSRYVLNAAEPFIVSLTHHGGDRTEPVTEPFMTVTGANRGEKALVVAELVRPFVTYGQHGGANRSAGDPAHTITASRKDRNAVVAAHLTKFRTDSIGADLRDPAPTATANSFIKRPGGAAPIGLVAAFLAQHNVSRGNVQNPGRDGRLPVSTVLQSGSHQAVVAAEILNLKGSDRRGSSPESPAPTQCADGNHIAATTAFITKYHGVGGQHAAVSEPLRTVDTTDRFGLAEVVASLPPLTESQAVRARAVADLLRSHGLWDGREFVTFQLYGATVVIADIGMRMFVPRELFRANGFPDSYVIDRGIAVDAVIEEDALKPPPTIAISKTEQVSKCGNSVCPPMAEALVRANFAPMEVNERGVPEFALRAAE